MLDPQKTSDSLYYRVFRQISAGPYTFTAEQGLRIGIEGITMDDVGVRPSRLQLATLLAMLPPAGAAAPTPAQTRDMIAKMASLYEGVRIGNSEIRGLSMETPQGPFKLAAMRYNLENGKVGEFALEGLDSRTPKGPFRVEPFALKSLDMPNLFPLSPSFSAPPQNPSPNHLPAL